MRRLLVALALTSAGFAQIVVINGSDTISGSRSTINNNFAYLNTNKEALLTFTSPLLRTSNTITCRAATGSVSGCLSAADWTTFNAKGGVSSVGFTGDGTVFNATVPGSPVTSSGLFAPTLHTQSANLFFAGPTTGGAATPAWRLLVSADIPNNAANTAGNAATATALAADPADCTAGQFATGINASGVPACGTPTGTAPTHAFVCNLGSPKGTSVISTGDVCYSDTGSYSGTINAVSMTGNAASLATCSITMDVWKANAAYPTAGNIISAAAPGTLAGSNTNDAGSVGSWTKPVVAHDRWAASVASVTGCVYVQLRVEFQ